MGLLLDDNINGIITIVAIHFSTIFLNITTSRFYQGSKELDLAAFDQFMTVLRRGTNAGSREVHMLHDYKSSGVYRCQNEMVEEVVLLLFCILGIGLSLTLRPTTYKCSSTDFLRSRSFYHRKKKE